MPRGPVAPPRHVGDQRLYPGLVAPHWSPAVVAEAARAVARWRPDRPGAAMRRRFDAMNRAFPHASSDATEDGIARFALPGLNDRHVAAAAQACEAEIIVTHNTKDFPAAVMGVIKIGGALLGLAAVAPARRESSSGK